MLATTDEQLVERVRSGDRQAFEELVKRYHQRLVSFLMTILGNADDAHEVAQDTFVKAYQSLASLRLGETVVPWLFKISHRMGLNRLRANKVRSRWQADKDPAEEEICDTDSAVHPHEAYLKADSQKAVTRTIGRLPEKYSSVVWLRFGEEMKVAEIAAALGLSRAATESRLRRGTQLLKEELLRVFPELCGECEHEMQHSSKARIQTH